MQLIDCPRCGQSCDPKHRHCPACGWDVRRPAPAKHAPHPQASAWVHVRHLIADRRVWIMLVGIGGMLSMALVVSRIPQLGQAGTALGGILIAGAIFVGIVVLLIRMIAIVVTHSQNQDEMIRTLHDIRDALERTGSKPGGKL